MTEVVYFEPLEAGHCAFYARMVLAAASHDARVSRLRLVTSPALAERLADVVKSTGLELSYIPEAELERFREGSLLARGRAQWAGARTAIETPGARVFLPFFDHALYGALLDRKPVKGKVSGIIFRPPNDYGYAASPKRLLSSLRRWGSYACARRPALGTLFTLDELAAAQSGQGMRHLHYLPDPAPDPALLAAAPEAIKGDRCRMLLFGALTKRKGIFVLLDALGQLPAEARARLEIRLVGRLDSADRDRFLVELARLQAVVPELAITLEDRFVEEIELAAEVMAADVILAPYQNHIGSSGVVLWAATAGKPLISQNTGLMGYQMEQYSLGIPTDTTDPAALAHALAAPTKLLSNPLPFAANRTEALSAQTVLDGMLG